MSASSGHGGGDPFSSDSAPISATVMSARSAAALQSARARNPLATREAVVFDALKEKFSAFRTKEGKDVDLEFFNRMSASSVKTKVFGERDGPGDSHSLPIFYKMGMRDIFKLGSETTAILIDERERPLKKPSHEAAAKAVDDAYCADRNRVIVYRADVPAFMDVLYSRYELLSSIDQWGDDVEAKRKGKKASNAMKNRAENNESGVDPRASKRSRESILADRKRGSEEDSSAEIHPAAGEVGSSLIPSSSLPRGESSASDSARGPAAGGSTDIE